MYNRLMALRTGGLLLTLLVTAGCASREVEKDLRVVDVRTGWYDLGIVDGQNKLVPSISV